MKTKIKMVRVDATEYDALCELRDGVHEALKLKLQHIEAHYKDALAINATQLNTLNIRDLTVRHLREKNAEQHALILQMQKRLAELEPVKIAAEQPLFARAK